MAQDPYAFANFKTIQSGDRFYLRLQGNIHIVEEANSGWVCRSTNGAALLVVWSPEIPQDVVLWRATDDLGAGGGTLLITVDGAVNTGLTFVNQAITLGLPPVRWTLNRFGGYSNNAVPGYGWEPNAFTMTLEGAGSGRAVGLNFIDQRTLELLYIEEAPAPPAAHCSLLYVDGQRDRGRLSAQGQVCFNVREAVSGMFLAFADMATAGQSRRAILTPSPADAALCQLKALHATDVGYQFMLGIVGSPLLLGTDANKQLVFGNAGGDFANVASTTISVGKDQFDFDTVQDWAVGVGISDFYVAQDLTLVPLSGSSANFSAASVLNTGRRPTLHGRNHAMAPQAALRFEFRLNSFERLRLGFTDLLQGRVGIMKPLLYLAKSNGTGDQNPETALVVGQKQHPGCLTFPASYTVSWAPEVVPVVDLPIALGDCSLRWLSGNTSDPGGNVFWVSATGENGSYQNTFTVLRSYPMQDQAQLFYDLEAQAVPRNCGAIKLIPYESNLGSLSNELFRNYVPACERWVLDPVVNPNDEGNVTIFIRKTGNGVNSCDAAFYMMSSSDAQVFPLVIVEVITVPENLQVEIHTETPLVSQFTLGPGTYSASIIKALHPEWPLNTNMTAWLYCSAINPRTLFIAKTCSGFPGSKSLAWQPQSTDCDQFMQNACVGPLFNSASCGCFQDIARAQAKGLPSALIAQIIPNPQCTGPVCALGSAYRKRTWDAPCQDVCRQIIIGRGTDYIQAGDQTLACGGDIYNVGQGDAPAPALKKKADAGWIVAFAVFSVVAAIFLVVFIVYWLRAK